MLHCRLHGDKQRRKQPRLDQEFTDLFQFAFWHAIVIIELDFKVIEYKQLVIGSTKIAEKNLLFPSFCSHCQGEKQKQFRQSIQFLFYDM